MDIELEVVVVPVPDAGHGGNEEETGHPRPDWLRAAHGGRAVRRSRKANLRTIT
ncbi:MAG TPA: hypothetical protein VK425_12090 [Acidimicrobiales bacterium]|nr:hypothetical protein [Acidimicrobiales bacterium]